MIKDFFFFGLRKKILLTKLMDKGNNSLPKYDCKHILYLFCPPKKFQASFMTFALYYTFFLSSLLTNSIHNYYKCYHFCFFSFLPLFLACSIIDKGYLGFVSITNYSDCFDKLHNKTRYSNTCI